MKVLREIITNPQKSDMGSGFGYVDGAIGCTLKEVLDFYVKNNKSWGTVYIYRNNDVIRIFDYDTYNNNVFYHHLSGWQYQFIVKEVKIEYCFMNKDIYIYLG